MCSMYVCYVCLFNHSYMCGFGCSRNVFCSVVSAVGIWCIMLSCGVYIYVSFNIGWGCLSIGDNGGNANGVCVSVLLLVVCPKIGLMRG